MAIMAFQSVCIMLLSCIALSASQSCGSTSCSQKYGAHCRPDMSTHLYDSSMMTKSTCSKSIEPADSLSADCYDTCVIGSPFGDPSVPVMCCADFFRSTEVMSVKKDRKTLTLIIDIHPPAAGSNFYQLNKFCKYNIQCPNENYMLHYTVVRFNAEPPDASGQCLDFLRYHFSATGGEIYEDVCGSKETLSKKVMSGYHGSGLTLDFRSNRIHSKGGFHLGITCTLPSKTAPANSDHQKRQTSNSFSISCSSPQSLNSRTNANKPTTATDYFGKVFPGYFRSRRSIIITRGSVVKYRSRVIVVERKGRILHRFRRIRKLQVHNRIEGYLSFVRSSSPSGRTFPGYGFLRVGWTGVAQYVQTIVDPMYLLTDEEDETVRELFEERYNRILKLDDDTEQSVNCGINRLAELNIASCSEVVRAVANFFLETDPFQSYCRPSQTLRY